MPDSNPVSKTVNIGATVFNNESLNINDVITFKIEYIVPKLTGYKWIGNTQNITNINTLISVSPTSDSTIFNNPAIGLATDGDLISLNDTIPDSLNQIDLFTDLIKRYNLMIRVDSDNNKKLLLDTREDFYNAGSQLDWTDKKDYSTEDKIELI